jgi:hypothetical protein
VRWRGRERDKEKSKYSLMMFDGADAEEVETGFVVVGIGFKLTVEVDGRRLLIVVDDVEKLDDEKEEER